jgi:hypothetical protein
MAQQKIWLKWTYPGIIWGNNAYIWSEVYILINVAESMGGGGGGIVLNNKRPWKDVEKTLKKKNFSEEDRKKFLEVVVRINGISKKEVRELDELKKLVTVEHIKNTLSKVATNITVNAIDIKKQ